MLSFVVSAALDTPVQTSCIYFWSVPMSTPSMPILAMLFQGLSANETYAQRACRFKFTPREDNDFYHTVYPSVSYIKKKPVKHVADEAPSYQVSRWLATVSIDALWQTLRLCWINVYSGLPDIIAHSSAKTFMAEQFSSQPNTLQVRTKSIPDESASWWQFSNVITTLHTSCLQSYSCQSSRCRSGPCFTNGCQGNQIFSGHGRIGSDVTCLWYPPSSRPPTRTANAINIFPF